MNNVSGHTASFLGGSMLATAILGILTGQFHVQSELASDWLIVSAAILGGPVLAYLAVKAQSDPALAAALAAINAMTPGNGQNGATVSAAPHATVVTTSPTPVPTPAAAAAPVEGAPTHA